MDPAALEVSLRRVLPAVRLVKERHLRRALRILRDSGASAVPYPEHGVWLGRGTTTSLGIFPKSVTAGTELRLLLLLEPDDCLPRATPEPAVLRHYWREVFRGRLSEAARAEAAKRWWELDEATRAEVEFLLTSEHLLPTFPTIADLYATFAAEFLSRYHFSPPSLAFTFPSIEVKHALAVIRRDVNDEELLRGTRPDGVTDRPDTVVPAPSPPVSTPPATVKRAEQAERVRNDVRAAILRTKVAEATPSGSTKHRKAAKAAVAERLVPRLAAVFGRDAATQRQWAEALIPVLPAAASGYWSPAAKALYDLQKAALDLEADIYAVDPAGWARSFGRRPVLRKLTLSRRTILLSHLKTAHTHLTKADLAESQRADLDALLLAEIAAAECALREEVEPILRRVLADVGLVPTNVPEAVAADKLVGELLDDMCEKGHLRLADLRDAIARNRLKLPDLTGPSELLLGDGLLRADARLGDELDGIYHRGEAYLRWIQRGSAAAFGTRVGRFFTRFVAMPFGGAVLTVEFTRYLAHETGKVYRLVSGLVTHQDEPAEVVTGGRLPLPAADEEEPDDAPPADEGVPVAAPPAEGTTATAVQAPAPKHAAVFTTGSVAAIVVVGVVFLAAINSKRFRSLCGLALRWVGRLLYAVVVAGPRRVWRSAPLRAIRTNRTLRVSVDRLGWPFVVAATAALFLWLLGASPGRTTRWGVGTFLAVAAVLNLPFGRRFQERFEERVSDSWRTIRTDLIPGIVSFVVWLFRALVGAVDRWLYTVDEWLRFRERQSKPSLVLKVVLGVVWFPVAYVVRFAFYLLIEPQVNPLKHFPVVTVSHKILLPMIPSLAKATGLSLEAVGSVVWGIPGIFGFIVWELKENWRLYAANRPRRLGPVVVGHHGETVRGLLRPGFHSGTVPVAFRKVRAALAKAERNGTTAAAAKQQETLHHVEAEVVHLIDRELLDLLRQTAAWRGLTPEVIHVHLGLQRIAAQVEVSELAAEPTVIEFTRIDDAIHMKVPETGFVASLNAEQSEVWERALEGLKAIAAAAVGDGPRWTEWVEFWESKK